MISFSLFGVHVKIHPSIWVTLALMAYMLGRGEHGWLGGALFVVAGFICIFAHEMGHALSGRWLGGGRPLVELAYVGGVCTNNVSQLSRGGTIIMIAAGPLTSLALTLPAFTWLYSIDCSAYRAMLRMLAMLYGIMPAHLVEAYPPMIVLFVTYVVQVSLWWSLLNLLPIYPLDGGMIMHNLIHSPRVMHIVSMAVAVLLIAGCLCMGYHAMLCILVILILLNYHGMKNAPY